MNNSLSRLSLKHTSPARTSPGRTSSGRTSLGRTSLVAGAFAVTLLASASALAADVTLRISLQLPLKSHLGQNLAMFESEVEEKSGGAIDVEIYDSAQLYKDKEVPAAVGSGSIEMGVASRRAMWVMCPQLISFTSHFCSIPKTKFATQWPRARR